MFVRYFCFYVSKKFQSFDFRRLLVLCLLTPCLLLLAACGGGGGGGSGSGEVVSPEPVTGSTGGAPDPDVLTLKAIPEGWETDPEVWAAGAEFAAQAGLTDIGIAYGYAAGVTGAGQVIGFIDTGLDDAHEAFSDGRVVLNDRSGLTLADNVQLGHGTSVAGVAAAAKDDTAIHGVAFNADVAMWSLHMNSAGNLTVSNAILTNAVTGLQSSGARVINQSWGYKTLLAPDLVTTQQAFLLGQYPDMIDEMRRGAAVHVWAAGNEGGEHVAVTSALPTLFPELAGLNVAVVALDEDGVIATSSNRCGAMAENCLAAPGGASVASAANTIVPVAGGGYGYAHGTSFAAPYISGVLALMMEAFGDQLSNREYTARLLATADNAGLYSDPEVYGRGVVNLQAALSPAGALNIPMPGGGLIAPSSSFVNSGMLPEDMLEQLESEEIIVLDSLDTPFKVPLSAFVGSARDGAQTDMSQLVPLDQPAPTGDAAQSWMGIAVAQTTLLAPATAPYLRPYHAQSGFMNIGRTPLPLAADIVVTHFAGRTDNARDGAQFVGLSAQYTPASGPSDMRFHGGILVETAGLLGSIGQGALETGAGHTTFLGVAGEKHLSGGVQVGYRADIGFSALTGKTSGLVQGAENLVSTRFEVDFPWQGWALRLAQPIYFENGALDLRLPTKRIADGGVAFRDQSVALSQNRSADMHVEKDYDLGGVTLRLRGDTRLTGAGAHDARLGVGLYWSLGG